LKYIKKQPLSTVLKDTSDFKILRRIQNPFWILNIGIDFRTGQFFIEYPPTGSSIRVFSLTERSMCQFKGMRQYKPNKFFDLIEEDGYWYLYDKVIHQSGIYKEDAYKILLLTPLQALAVKRIQKSKECHDKS